MRRGSAGRSAPESSSASGFQKLTTIRIVVEVAGFCGLAAWEERVFGGSQSVHLHLHHGPIPHKKSKKPELQTYDREAHRSMGVKRSGIAYVASRHMLDTRMGDLWLARQVSGSIRYSRVRQICLTVIHCLYFESYPLFGFASFIRRTTHLGLGFSFALLVSFGVQ